VIYRCQPPSIVAVKMLEFLLKKLATFNKTEKLAASDQYYKRRICQNFLPHTEQVGKCLCTHSRISNLMLILRKCTKLYSNFAVKKSSLMHVIRILTKSLIPQSRSSDTSLISYSL